MADIEENLLTQTNYLIDVLYYLKKKYCSI